MTECVTGRAEESTYELAVAMKWAAHLERTTALEPAAIYCEQHRGWHVIEGALTVGLWEPPTTPELEPVEAELGEFRLADTFARVTAVVALTLAAVAVLIR